jgi:hypothetical protein
VSVEVPRQCVGKIEFKHGCRKAGANGHVVKDAIHAELLDGIRTVLGGKT